MFKFLILFKKKKFLFRYLERESDDASTRIRDISVGRQLFVDDWLIHTMSGLDHVHHTATQVNGPRKVSTVQNSRFFFSSLSNQWFFNRYFFCPTFYYIFLSSLRARVCPVQLSMSSGAFIQVQTESVGGCLLLFKKNYTSPPVVIFVSPLTHPNV